ncbi:MAG: hypothetical protein WCR51_13565 [Planctomycetia bacterium]
MKRATAAGPPSPGGTQVPAWRRWCPGLDNDDLTLREVLATLPAAPPTAIPWIVRLFENPHGWLRLHGAVDLAHHDRIHVLLGRGLLGQDEAFVIGFTMGCTKRLSAMEQAFFKFVAANVYPEPYRIAWQTLAAYDLGVEAGRALGVRNLHHAVGDDLLDRHLGEVRRALGIDTGRLRDFYARERTALPDTAASARLPAGSPPGSPRLGRQQAA